MPVDFHAYAFNQHEVKSHDTACNVCLTYCGLRIADAAILEAISAGHPKCQGCEAMKPKTEKKTDE